MSLLLVAMHLFLVASSYYARPPTVRWTEDRHAWARRAVRLVARLQAARAPRAMAACEGKLRTEGKKKEPLFFR